MLRLRTIFTIVVIFTMVSCTKTEEVSGVYRGTANGYTCGTNVESTIIVTRVDDEMVNFECDFNGWLKYYSNASVYLGNDKYMISDGKGMIAVIRGWEMFFQFTDKKYPQKSISFYGTK